MAVALAVAAAAAVPASTAATASDCCCGGCSRKTVQRLQIFGSTAAVELAAAAAAAVTCTLMVRINWAQPGWDLCPHHLKHNNQMAAGRGSGCALVTWAAQQSNGSRGAAGCDAAKYLPARDDDGIELSRRHGHQLSQLWDMSRMRPGQLGGGRRHCGCIDVCVLTRPPVGGGRWATRVYQGIKDYLRDAHPVNSHPPESPLHAACPAVESHIPSVC